MNCEKAPTGKPSEDRRWMQYYPEMMLKMIQKPECTLWEYLEQHCPRQTHEWLATANSIFFYFLSF